MKNNQSDFEDLFESNAQQLSITISHRQPTGEALGESSGETHATHATAMPSPLWNRKEAKYIRQQELPWHRTCLEMAANGYTAEEIAARLGCTPPTVQEVLRQPQYQQTQVNLIRRAADQDHEVCELIKANVKLAVKTLASVMSDEKARNGDRISAARELLDRRYGKPNQPMNRGTDVDLNNLSDKELAAMLPDTSTGTNA